MTVNSQAREDDNYACKIFGKVFSYVKEVSNHQRVHKTGDSASPPPKNPYDHDAFVFPGEQSEEEEEEEEEEEGEITSEDDRRRQGTLECRKAATIDGSSPELKEHKKEDFSPDELEVAEGLLMLRYGIVAPLGVCSSATALDSNCPPIPVIQENHKMEGNVIVDPQTVAEPNQEDDCLGKPITEMVKVNITGHKMKESKSTDGEGSIVFEWPRCPKRLRTQQRSNTKTATMAEGGTSASAQVFKEYKCEICGATFDSDQAFGRHQRKHAKGKLVDVDNDQPEKNLIVVDDDTGLEIDLNIPAQVPEDMTTVVVDDCAAAEDVIMEDIRERNDDCKRSRPTFDLNQSPSDIMKGIDLNLEPVDIDED